MKNMSFKLINCVLVKRNKVCVHFMYLDMQIVKNIYQYYQYIECLFNDSFMHYILLNSY